MPARFRGGHAVLRWVRNGALIGGAAGTLFAVAVVCFADCAGPDCNRERMLGILLHLAAGLAIGAVIGLLGAVLRRMLRRTA